MISNISCTGRSCDSLRLLLKEVSLEIILGTMRCFKNKGEASGANGVSWTGIEAICCHTVKYTLCACFSFVTFPETLGFPILQYSPSKKFKYIYSAVEVYPKIVGIENGRI